MGNKRGWWGRKRNVACIVIYEGLYICVYIYDIYRYIYMKIVGRKGLWEGGTNKGGWERQTSTYLGVHVWKCRKKPNLECRYCTACVWRWENTLVGVSFVFWPCRFQAWTWVEAPNLLSLTGTRRLLFYTPAKNVTSFFYSFFIYTLLFVFWILVESCTYRDIWQSRIEWKTERSSNKSLLVPPSSGGLRSRAAALQSHHRTGINKQTNYSCFHMIPADR